MTPGGLRANFRKYGIRSEIGALSPHDLRRTMATLLVDAGAPTRLVQELGAWSDVRMVERYTRNLKADQIEKYSPLVRSMKLSK
jgi:integrase